MLFTVLQPWAWSALERAPGAPELECVCCCFSGVIYCTSVCTLGVLIYQGDSVVTTWKEEFVTDISQEKRVCHTTLDHMGKK